MQETWVRPLDPEDLLKKGMATPCGILAWTILWREEPGGLQSVGSQRVGHDEQLNNRELRFHMSLGRPKIYINSTTQA